jgi:hypothetical protein
MGGEAEGRAAYQATDGAYKPHQRLLNYHMGGDPKKGMEQPV